MKLDPSLTSLMKFSSKLMKDLNVRPGTKKLLGENLLDMGLGNDFLDETPKTQEEK